LGSDGHDADATPTDDAAARVDRAGFDQAGRVVRCHRFAPLLDGIEYFAAVRRALLAARRQVWVLGWEIHSEIDLLRGEAAEEAKEAGEPPVRLADLLMHLVEERPELHVRLQIWEGASLFAAERQHLPRMKRPWADHPRIELVWDEGAPALASRHQKVVVVDDRVAFAGGMDLTRRRWDAHEHRPGDRRRRPPGLIPRLAAPYHDLMTVSDGAAARALGDLVRERWRQATGQVIDPPAPAGAASATGAGDDADDASPGGMHKGVDCAPRDRDDDPAADAWPDDVEPALRQRELAIAVTEPETDPSGGRGEVKATFLAQVAAARRLIFVESQYFTAGAVADALASRLAEPDGPEVVLILPWGCPQRIQAMAHDPHRDRLLEQLREVAPDGRFGVYWVTRDGPEPDQPHDASVYVHAKLLVVDEALLRIGSANLNNRSMHLETECDLFIGAPEEDRDGRAAITALRRRILGHMLDVDAEAVAVAEREAGDRVLPAIEALRGGRWTLVPFEHHAPEDIAATAFPLELADPDHPLSIDDVQTVMRTMRSHQRVRTWLSRRWNALVGGLRRSPGRISAAILVVAALLAYPLTPLGGLGLEQAIARLHELTAGPTGLAGVLVGFVVLATLGVPVTVLLVALGVVQGVLLGIGFGLAGVLGSAAAGRAIGGLFPERCDPDDDGEGEHLLRRVARHVRRRGTLSMVLIRNLPVAPFGVVSVACGVAGVPWSSFLLGTALGMLPGIVLLVLLGRGIAGLLTNPEPVHLLLVGLAVVAILGLTALADGLRATRDGCVDEAVDADQDDAEAPEDRSSRAARPRRAGEDG
jgi:phosphatidylserine/phosphatidylglycerophosphate/cardiolipin synthase-like enzyme/uncharacterized membrane protein YdjX (TVP38/TMEM64 family)